MLLRSLDLTNFKNIANAHLEFVPKVNCLLGNNGMGKSNLLDAIHYLSFVRSFGRLPDNMLISKSEDFAILKGCYFRNDVEEEITAGLRRGQRKSFRRGGKEYKRLSNHIGFIPAVMIAPCDLTLIIGAAEERRRFVDMIISQSDPAYLDALIRYDQALEQRNKLLRDECGDLSLYEAIEMSMSFAAEIITSARRAFTGQLEGLFQRYYAALSPDNEVVSLSYCQSGSEHPSFADALNAVRERDRMLKHTTFGPHRDDLVFALNDMPVRQTASQGQTKTFTIALRFAQYDFLRQATGQKPLLLLDDIFDKLDSDRVEQIIKLVGSEEYGQIFITDTNAKRLDRIIKQHSDNYALWSVQDGSFTAITI